MIDTVLQCQSRELPEQINRPLTRIKRNCEELQDMVKNYLDLSRAERGELVANKTTGLFLAEVVQACITMATPLLRSRGITLELNCPETLAVEADMELMRIALTNYLTNVAKYGREGGAARLQVRSDSGQITVSVWNEGEGFPEEDRDKLFGKFSRLHNKNTQGKRGSGLGLFLCRQVLELHDGTVSAESEPGEWAKFSFTFPSSSQQS